MDRPSEIRDADFDLKESLEVNAGDLLRLLSAIRQNSEGTEPKYDFNCDGEIDHADMVLFASKWKIRIVL
jgi:hypothetical protein